MREEAAGAAKIGTTGRGIGPAYEDKVGRRGDPRRRPRRRGDARDPHRPAARPPRRAARAASAPPPIDRAALHGRAAGGRAEGAALRRAGLAGARPRSAARASASSSRARRARCSTSTSAPIPTSPRRTPLAGRRRPAPAWGPGRVGFVLGIVKAYTTRVGEGPFPTELDRRDRPAARRARPRVRHRHRPQAPLRLVRRGAGAPDLHHRAASTASR